MVIAADYPFLDILWTMLIAFAWVIWFWILIKVVADLFRRRDIGGGRKTLWIILMVFVPFVGVLAYLVSQGDDMARRDAQQARSRRRGAMSAASVPGNGGAVGQIERAKRLLDEGAITEDEFAVLKSSAVG